MGIKKVIKNIQHEIKAVKGEASKDRSYSNSNTFPDLETARKEFERSRQKLFDVNKWSDLPGFTFRFELHDSLGNRSHAHKIAVNDFIRILIPGLSPENWVKIIDIKSHDTFAEYTVRPSENPQKDSSHNKEIDHFFIKEARNIFRIELQGNTITAREIGLNEAINNRGEEAANRGIINTLIAEGGWLGVQKIQWENVTEYLVHLKEANS